MPPLIVLALVGLAAQAVDGSLGMAYGVTSSTLLVSAGVTPAIASASVHLAEVGTTLISGISHHRFGNVDWKIVLRLGVPGAIGAFLGASVLTNISTSAATPWTAGVLLALGALLLVRFAFKGERKGRQHLGFSKRFLAPLGLVAGFVDATGGGGWGPVATPTMLISGRTEPRKVVGSVSTSEFLVASAASIGFLINLGDEAISWRVVLALVAGGAIAAPFAAFMVRHMAPRVLGTAVGGLIVLTNSRTLTNELGWGDAARWSVYVLVTVVWVAAVTLAVRGHRRTARPSLSDEADVDLALESA
jgi:uncharacterized membrane protein YfcA